MSEGINLATPLPPLMDAAHQDPASKDSALHQLGARDLAQLLMGFHFLFWGLLVMLAALTESMVSATLRPFWVVFVFMSSLAMIVGAWRLNRVNLGKSWCHRTRDLLIATSLAAYLCIFYIMWLRTPTTLYFLVHTLVFGAVVIFLLCLLCLPVGALAKAAGRRNLAVQCIGFGTVAVILLFPAYGRIALAMLTEAHKGHDPYLLLQYWIEQSSVLLMLLALLPFSLTLSLLWSAKDLVWEHLHARESSPTPPSA